MRRAIGAWAHPSGSSACDGAKGVGFVSRQGVTNWKKLIKYLIIPMHKYAKSALNPIYFSFKF